MVSDPAAARILREIDAGLGAAIERLEIDAGGGAENGHYVNSSTASEAAASQPCVSDNSGSKVGQLSPMKCADDASRVLTASDACGGSDLAPFVALTEDYATLVAASPRELLDLDMMRCRAAVGQGHGRARSRSLKTVAPLGAALLGFVMLNLSCISPPPETGEEDQVSSALSTGFKFLITDYGQAPWTGADLQSALDYHGLGSASLNIPYTATSLSGQRMRLMGEWDYTYYYVKPGETVGDGTIRDAQDCYNYPGCYAAGPATPAEGYSRLALYLQHHTPALPAGWVHTSVPGHGWYQHYSGSIAANQIIGAENGAGTGNFQSHLAFARGAGRQFGWEWLMDYSSWFGTAVRATRYSYASGATWCSTCGHSDSLMKRLFYLSWLGGANYIHDEGGALDYFQELPKNANGVLNLSGTGQVAKAFLDFTRSQDRGTPFVPTAVVLNRYHGIGGAWSSGKIWEYIPWVTGDQNWWTYALFNQVLWPSGFNNTNYSPSEDQDMVPHPHGYSDQMDVLTEDATPSALSSYNILVLSGPLEMSAAFIAKLNALLQSGKRVVLSPGLVSLAPLFTPGGGQLYVPGDLSVFAQHLKAAYEVYAPFKVSGSHISYQISTRADGSKLLAIYNNRGVNKAISSSAVETFNSNYNSVVSVYRSGTYFSNVTKLLGASAPTFDYGKITVMVPAGEVTILKIETVNSLTLPAPLTLGGDYMTSNAACNLSNPVTGTVGCPAGYTASIVFGAMGPNVCTGANDQEFKTVCVSTAPQPTQRSLGGYYQTSNSGCSRPNPKTGSPSCPAGYSDAVVYGVMGPNTCTGANDQTWLHACYGSTADASSIKLGGYYQTSNTGCSMNNPALPGIAGCPGGYTDSVVFGSMGPNICTGANDQQFLHLCWKN